MPYVDFSLVVEGLVATGMQPSAIAKRLGVARSTVCRWRLGQDVPRFVAGQCLLELAEQYTAQRLELFRKRNEMRVT